jgi:hypothetical protein
METRSKWDVASAFRGFFQGGCAFELDVQASLYLARGPFYEA